MRVRPAAPLFPINRCRVPSFAFRALLLVVRDPLLPGSWAGGTALRAKCRCQLRFSIARDLNETTCLRDSDLEDESRLNSDTLSLPGGARTLLVAAL